MSDGQNAGHMDWAEKYRPASLSDIVGNDAAVKALRKWAETYGTGKRAVILYGGPGIGKTSAALALAHDMGWDYIEMNASDQRTKDAINKIAGSASNTGTFAGTGGRRLLILDEADNLHGNYDRGGEAAMIKLIKTASQPIILIANDFYALSKPLRDLADPIQFRAILSSSVVKVLRKVCAAEDIKCQPDALMKIAERTNDLRSAINDLQAAAIGTKEVTLADVSTGERDVSESIFKVLGLIFRGDSAKKAQDAVRDLDESPEDLVGWVDENLARQYRDDDLERGYDVLSKADMFLGRVRRRQDYGMWRYASFLMVSGMNKARRHRYGGYTKYNAPTYWQKLGRAKTGRTVRDSIAAKLGRHIHTSKAEARAIFIPLLRQLFEDEAYAIGLSARLRLEEDEIAFLMDAEKTSRKVGSIYEKSRDLIEKEVEEEIDAFAHFEHKAPASLVEEKPSKPKRKRKVSRDGGEEIDVPDTIAEAVPEAPKEEPLPVVKEEPLAKHKDEPPAEPKRQKTLFEF